MVVVLVLLGLAAAVVLGRQLDRAIAMRNARAALLSARHADGHRLGPGESLRRIHERGSVEFR